MKTWVVELNRIYNTGITNGKDRFKELFKVLSSQGKVNQNDPVIPPYTNQNGYDQNLR